jgi:hypothetical protein
MIPHRIPGGKPVVYLRCRQETIIHIGSVQVAVKKDAAIAPLIVGEDGRVNEITFTFKVSKVTTGWHEPGYLAIDFERRVSFDHVLSIKPTARHINGNNSCLYAVANRDVPPTHDGTQIGTSCAENVSGTGAECPLLCVNIRRKQQCNASNENGKRKK